jgi:polyisoprenoid-binding protein YceI
MTPRYRLGPELSQFKVQAFASGMLSFLGHSPTFAVRDFSGAVAFEGGTINGLRLEISVRAESLQLVDQVSAADRTEIEGAMRRDVLETAVYPEIRFVSDEASGAELARGYYRVRVAGRLSLHGVTRPHAVDAEVLLFADGVRMRGEGPLRLSDYRIRPVTALGGTIRLKDELKVSFNLAGLPEGA